ncbi:MAG: peptidoglycan-binding protein [Alphaproteobacteria bacterium]|nr:peptidoglycan-binding protein [Alphaproteobacteria bacterium]
MLQRRHRDAPPSAPDPMSFDEDVEPDAGLGNAAMQELLLAGGADDGPTGSPELDGALSMAFCDDLGGVEAHFGETAENDALGAVAHAEGNRASFGEGIQPGKPDELPPEALNVIAHEMAHALSAVSKDEGVDLPGDRGEAAADAAGDGFQRWGERGFQGPAPRLRPAEGGGASIQRKAKAGASGLTGRPALQRGSRGGQVSTLQTLLRRHGHTVSVDGDFGPKTEAAVRAFQKARGLSVDGVVGPRTAAKLNGSPKKPASTDLSKWLPLRQGDRNTGVSRAQRLLNRFGAGLSTDGDFGPRTRRAVEGFQRANGLAVDGVIGPNTARKLNSDSARKIGAGGGGSMPGTYLGQYASYRYGRYQGMIDVVQMDGKKVALKTARAWKKLKDAARRDGVTLRLNSGFRTMAEQQELYRRYLAGTGNLAARPGYSNHQHGQALDISVTARSAYNWMHRNAPRYGWRRTVPSEAWHWEYFGS